MDLRKLHSYAMLAVLALLLIVSWVAIWFYLVILPTMKL
jgi:hypothetical protein